MIVAISAARFHLDFEPARHTLSPVHEAQSVRTGLKVAGMRGATGSTAEGTPRSTGVC
jgi:hypothetical protein